MADDPKNSREDNAQKTPQDKGEIHQGPDHSSPYPVERGAPAFNLVDTAQEIEKADQMVNTRVSGKLKVIADQIKALQAEAEEIMNSAQEDMELHKAQCNFQRQPGKIYHLYEKEDGTLYFSMLSEEDWNGNPPDTFRGSYRLEPDYSWTPADKIDEPDDTQALVNKLLESRGLD
ncbi:DUF2452 domain-containing protein [Thiohalorhabdus denitrificans]|uniref:DUF2452 domain-containing protein n=1 Tax=Thiohalorhabdus denitrificans TaxID=381306 RepID=A0A1G5AWM1_9GAMM|nr:DUF2452 domain-containing protein [Thiohalorhabdus denitrificans]SCX82224.1 Protein of unknown function [Thiohalorhabdus denitrificans]